VVLDRGGPRGEFAIYLNEERIFSRVTVGRLPEADDILPVLQRRLSQTVRALTQPPSDTI
jgi:hypothetical protein